MCVFGKQVVADDAPAMILRLKMRVREADKYFFDLVTPEIVRHVPHAVSAQARSVMVFGII